MLVPKISIKNLDKLIDKLNKYPRESETIVNKAIKVSIFDVQAKAVPMTPIKSGDLRRSYTTTFSNLRGILWPNIEYALYVHEGTRYMRGRPYLTDGLRSAQSKLDTNFQWAIDEISKKLAVR